MKLVKCLPVFITILLHINAAPVSLHCWRVSYDNGSGGRDIQSISNLVSEINQIYTQVAMQFHIAIIRETNSTYLANANLTIFVQYTDLCSIESGTGGLELYFVPTLEGGATAFQINPGIVIGPNVNSRTLAHEIGHACGLLDIYDTHHETDLEITGGPSRPRMPDDWGWYPSSATQTKIVRRLLMYGYKSDEKCDISFGDVYGIYYTNVWNQNYRRWDKNWLLDNAPIGFGRHGNRHPVSE